MPRTDKDSLTKWKTALVILSYKVEEGMEVGKEGKRERSRERSKRSRERE